MSKNLETKPHVKIGTIGHVEHGRTSLTEAILKYTAMCKEEYEARMNDFERSSEKIRGITINVKSKNDKHHH